MECEWACEVLDFFKICWMLSANNAWDTTNFTIFCSNLMWQIVISATILSHKTTIDITFIVHQLWPVNSTIVKKVVKFVVYLDLLFSLWMWVPLSCFSIFVFVIFQYLAICRSYLYLWGPWSSLLAKLKYQMYQNVQAMWVSQACFIYNNYMDFLNKKFIGPQRSPCFE